MRKKQTQTQKQRVTGRIIIVRYFIYFVFLILVLRLFFWQVLQGENLRAIAESQYFSVLRSHGSRGTILTADGYPLVTNQDVYTVFVEPKNLELSPLELSKVLSPYFVQSSLVQESTDEAGIKLLTKEWEDTIQQRLTNSLQWISLKKKLPRKMKEEIEKLKIAGLGFDREEMRYYPEASMSSQILGFVGSDASGEERGYFGIEGYFDRELKGKTGVLKQEKDAAGLPIAIGEFDLIHSRDGRDVTLTIRRDLQYMLEEKLKKGMEKYGSTTAEAVIMDPSTGEILAMASYPSYDPLLYYTYDQQLYKQPLISDLFEPGSTLKILTVAAGIDAGVIEPDSVCDRCAGLREISGYTIKTWNNEYNPESTVTDGLVHSDNTVMIYVAEKLPMPTFVDYLKKFGLDSKTDIELQEETTAPFREKWKELDVATASFGQGIALNGMQMLQVAQVIANKGALLKPKLVKEVKDEGNSIETKTRFVRQVIKEETAEKVTEMMEQAALFGDAKWAVPKGYRIAGKTGTAQIPVAGHYDEEKTVASFIGFAPADKPQFVMLVKLREPTSSPWGSETAAPLWFDIAKELFIRLQIAPDYSEK